MGIVGTPPWSDDEMDTNMFLASTSAMFEHGHDMKVGFDNGTNAVIEATVRLIERDSGGRVDDDEKRMLRIQMFLKRCVDWSRMHTPPASRLIIPGQRSQAAPGGLATLLP